ncbi:MAG TPA: hypothetical protein VLL54_17120 [Pyrinomonadaceae bacterium]|nr:hypothetical protein [Pyrinomonadaceae bacterium]
MSQEQPPNAPFVPPPPPPMVAGNPMFPPHELAAKEAEAASDAKTALILSIVGLLCFGFIFGIIAFRKASSAIEIIDMYQVAQDKRGIAMVAKILGILDIVGWVLVLVARIALR